VGPKWALFGLRVQVGVNIWAGFVSIWAFDLMFVGSNFGFNDEAQNLVAVYHIHFVNEKAIIYTYKKKKSNDFSVS
jgi:hypothetical protein